MKAMIFAAGLGTRLRPLTNTKPKALVEFDGEPMLKHVILNLEKFGVREIIVNVHHFADQVIDYLKANDNFGVDIKISDERSKLLDTGGGLKKAKDFFDREPFFVHNVDIISDIDLNELYNFHLKSNALATLAVRTRPSSRYLLFDSENMLSGWKNTVTGETIIARQVKELKEYAFSGIHVIDPEIFSMMTDQDAFSIIPLYLELSKSQNILAYCNDLCSWRDLGRIEDIQRKKD